jgi:Lrp/AsnC family transcriptional regulator for asnA, asnC and gidA
MDEKDRKIIEILEEDARTPFTEIAKMLNVSEATVRKRIARLERGGVIRRYTIEVDPVKLGYTTVTILGLDVEPEHFLDAARKLAEMSEVRWVATSTGDHMIMAEIWTRDGNELARLISQRIGRIKGVKKICPAIILEKIK